MKQRLLLSFVAVVLLAGLTVSVNGQTIGKVATIPQLQTVPLDSLRALDTLQAQTAGKPKDKSPYWHGSDTYADTVRVTGVVVVKPRILTYTLARYNIFIQDTATGQLWAGLNVLTNDTTTTAQGTGITALDTGMVVTITGRVTEYGSQNNSLTEMFAYNASSNFFTTVVPIEIVGQQNRPDPAEATVDSFAVGTKPMPSRGEKYEGMYVVIRNVTVVSVDVASGRFTFADAAGNQMTMYDGSGWYTYRGHKFSSSKYSAPPVGTKLKYIRGVIIPQVKSNTCGDYEIMPLYPGPKELGKATSYPGDIVIDKYAPSITTIRRNPTPPSSTDSVVVTFQAKDLNTSGQVDSAFVAVKVGMSGTWSKTKVATPTFVGADTLYSYAIGKAPKDSIVSYYVEAYSGGVYGAYPDPSIPYFYVVRDNGYSIYDVQYTPYSNGVPGLQYDTLTVNGTVVADTSDIKEIPTSGAQSGRPALWIAAKAGTWNGLCIWGATAGVGVDTLKKGDSISVRGVVYDYNSRTVLKVVSVTLLQRGVTPPAPTTMSISGAGSVSYQISNPPVNGNPTFEQWEGVLVRINNPYVVVRNADDLTNGSSSCFGEFLISSSSSTNNPYGLRVNDNGVNSFYADTNSYYRNTKYNTDHPATPNLKTNLIVIGQKLSFIQGILDYSYSNYKLEPRTNADFGTITSVLLQDPDVIARSYELSQNFPNPFNPSTEIRYAVPAAGRVSLKVFNLLGQLVETLVDQEMTAGSYAVRFNANRLSTGVYFYQLRAGDFVSTMKMVLMK